MLVDPWTVLIQVLQWTLVNRIDATEMATMVTNCIWAMQAAYDSSHVGGL